LLETNAEDDEFNDFDFQLDEEGNLQFNFDNFLNDPTRHLEEFPVADQQLMTRRIAEGQ